jgi:hypothetical protein
VNTDKLKEFKRLSTYAKDDDAVRLLMVVVPTARRRCRVTLPLAGASLAGKLDAKSLRRAVARARLR